MNRAQFVSHLEATLGDRQLVWFGTRGDDAESATELSQLESIYSLSGTYTRRFSVRSASLEERTGVRVDLDAFDIDEDPLEPAKDEFRRDLLSTLRSPSVVFTYRPSTFLSAVCFARSGLVDYAGMFHGMQAAFEHKPWVESEVGRLGIRSIPWRYVADTEQFRTLTELREGPIVLRTSRSSGGAGLRRVDEPSELEASWPHGDEAYVSVAPYLEPEFSINVGAVVWRDGVTLHPASLQLIGIPELTTRTFGYCGNDFAAMGDVAPNIVDEIEQATMTLGRWLGQRGFRGGFGVDFLVHDGVPLFTEINPRLQGSTHLSCQISVERDEPCILLEHLAASLDLTAPPTRHLDDYIGRTSGVSHFVLHHTGETPANIDPTPLVEQLRARPSVARADVLTRPDLRTDPGGTILRLTLRQRITETGFDLDATIANALASASAPQIAS